MHYYLCFHVIEFRLAVFVFLCHSNATFTNLTRDLHWAADSDILRRVRSSSSSKLLVPRIRLRQLVTLPSTLRQLVSGTIFCQPLLMPRLSLRSRNT